MARLARLVVPGLPHHITQRGNRRQQTFFCNEDYAAYLELMAEWCAEHGVAILVAMVADWRGLLDSAIPEEELRVVREHGHTGRPLGNSLFVDRLERVVGRPLHPQKAGRPSKLLKQP